MLTVFLDNRPGVLADAATALLATPSSDPFARDVLVVGQMGVGRWIEQGLATRCGVSANLTVTLPGRFLWQLVQLMVSGASEQSPFDPLVVRWAILDALDVIPEGDAFDALRDRWQSVTGAERMALATELGGLFERYMTYRRVWLNRWQANRACAPLGSDVRAKRSFEQHEPWQRWLWQQILQRINSLSDVHPFDAFAASLRQPATRGVGAAQGGNTGDNTERGSQLALFAPESDAGDITPDLDLPGVGRVVMFGLLNIPPEQFDLLIELARRIDITWFATDPAQGFWDEQVSAVRAARIALESPGQTWLYESEPAVLGEWGQEQRDFLVALRRREDDPHVQVIDDHLRSTLSTRGHDALSCLQQSIFELSDSPWTAYFNGRFNDTARDHSLQIHSCHSLLRQLEAVHDGLLGTFHDIPGLRASDVAIFCSDIDRAAPLVQAVFASGGLTPLPIHISGRRIDASAHARALLAFVDLVRGPASAGAVLDFLDMPLTRQVCHLDDLLLSRLQSVLARAGACRDDLDLVVPARHGWQRALQRIVLSGFTGDGNDDPVAGVLPVGPYDSALGAVLETLFSLLGDIQQLRGYETLFARPGTVNRENPEAARATAVQRSAAQWAALLMTWADKWLAPYDNDAPGLFRVRDALSALADATSGLADEVAAQQVPFDVVARALREHLDAQASVAQASGAITVAPLGSLRQVPFRVVAVVGLDQGQWPVREWRSEFDLVRADPQFGDQSTQRAARGIFLDTVLATSDRLLITYTGRDDRNNRVSNPARVVVELTDYLQTRRHAVHAEDGATHAPENWQHGWPVRQHPLQPFSPRRFTADALLSFASPWFDAAKRLPPAGQRGARLGPVCPGQAADSPGVATDGRVPGAVTGIGTLNNAFLDPARFLMQQRVEVSVRQFDQESPDIEPLQRVGHERYDTDDITDQVQRRLQLLGDAGRVMQWLAAQPALPDGAPGDRQAEQIMLRASALHAQHQEMLEAFGSVQLLDPAQHALRVALERHDASTLLTGLSDPLYQTEAGTLLQVMPAVDRMSVRLAIHLWHQHWLLVASDLPAGRPVTTVCAVERTAPGMSSRCVLLSGRDAAAGKQHLLTSLQLAQRAAQEPLALFPGTITAWLMAGGALDPDEDNYRADTSARNTYAGENRFSRAESTRPWPQALWRDSPPSFGDVLREGLRVYGPIWMQVTGQWDDQAAIDDPLGDDGIDHHLTGV